MLARHVGLLAAPAWGVSRSRAPVIEAKLRELVEGGSLLVRGAGGRWLEGGGVAMGVAPSDAFNKRWIKFKWAVNAAH